MVFPLASPPVSPVIVLGSGFVGSAVAAHLSRFGPVEVYDLPTHPELAERGSAGRQLLLDAIAASGATAVVNTCGLLRGTDDEMFDANVAWPTWLAHEVLPGTGARLVHLGSAAEYGDPGSADPIPETAPARPSGIYGETKWAGTRAVLEAREHGLDAVVGRGFNFVGPNLSPVSPLHQFLTDIEALPPEGGVVELWYPETVRDFILLDDLAAALGALATLEDPPPIMNLCSGVGVSFANIVVAMARRRGKPVEIRSLDRPGIRAVVGDPTLLWERCGLRPEMSAELIAERAGVAL